jgi:hypothetical protein
MSKNKNPMAKEIEKRIIVKKTSAVGLSEMSGSFKEEVTFVYETFTDGSDHVKFERTGLRLCDHEVPVMLNFDTTKVVSSSRVFLDGGVLKATCKLSYFDKLLFPAIQIKVLSNEFIGNLNCITDYEIIAIGLCSLPNTDPTILPIYKQLENNQTNM